MEEIKKYENSKKYFSKWPQDLFSDVDLVHSKVHSPATESRASGEAAPRVTQLRSARCHNTHETQLSTGFQRSQTRVFCEFEFAVNIHKLFWTLVSTVLLFSKLLQQCDSHSAIYSFVSFQGKQKKTLN